MRAQFMGSVPISYAKPCLHVTYFSPLLFCIGSMVTGWIMDKMGDGSILSVILNNNGPLLNTGLKIGTCKQGLNPCFIIGTMLQRLVSTRLYLNMHITRSNASYFQSLPLGRPGLRKAVSYRYWARFLRLWTVLRSTVGWHHRAIPL